MRRLAALLAAFVAFGLMSISLPWGTLDCPPPECIHETGPMEWGGFWGVLLLLGFYFVVPSVILTAILVAVLRLRDAYSPEDAAVRAALGETRGQAIRAETRRGLVDAGLWIGGAYVLTGVAHLVMLAFAGDSSFTREAGLWQTRLVMAVVAAASLVAAHAINGLRVGRTPREQLQPETAEPRERRISLGRRALVLGTVAAGAAGILVGTNLAFQGATEAAPTFAVVIATIAAWFFGASIVLGVWAVIVPAARDSSPWLVGRAGVIAGKVGARDISAVLQVRASTRWMSTTRALTVLAGLAFLFAYFAQTTPDLSHAAYAPVAAGVLAGDDADLSQCTTECDAIPAQLGQAHAVGSVVPSGTLGVSIDEPWGGLALIDPSDVDGVDDALAAQLRAEPSVALVTPYSDYSSVDDFDSLGITVTGMRPLAPNTPRSIVNRVWAEAQVGAVDNSYFAIYPAAGSSPAQASAAVANIPLDVHSWGTEQGVPSTWPSREGGASSKILTSDNAQLLLLWLIVGGIVIVPIAAVASAAVVRRRRDDATLAALGASVRSLRFCTVVEAVITAAAALSTGLLGGAMLTMTLRICERAIAGLWGVSTDNIIADAFASVVWPALLIAFVLGLVVFALVSWIASRSLNKLSPVEALRTAEEGALR